MQSQGMNGIATPKRSMRRPQCAELDDLYVPGRHGQLIIVRTESAVWSYFWVVGIALIPVGCDMA